jgi:hypothetical protein
MGKFYEKITPKHISFIEKQHIFFVGSAPLSKEGHINLSPKGLDCFKVLSSNRVAYMDLISSGNETSAHTLENGRITFMFCSFEKVPNILRLYGKGFTVLRDDVQWNEFSEQFRIYPSTRQIIVADITKVQTSCGFGVPLYEYIGERSLHFDWAETKGEKGLAEYIKEKNLLSLDGLPTPLLKENQ